MVNTRMDGRVDHLEARMAGVGQEIAHLDAEFTSLKELMVEDLKEMKNSKQSELRGKMVVESSALPAQGKVVSVEGPIVDVERDQMKYRRLDLPLFSSEDPLGLVFRVKRFFCMRNINGDKKLDAAIMALEGKALSWFL